MSIEEFTNKGNEEDMVVNWLYLAFIYAHVDDEGKGFKEFDWIGFHNTLKSYGCLLKDYIYRGRGRK